MGKVLTAHNAEITTASITVKSLTIERRQVTLALFRQLQEEDIFDWNAMALRGVAWGHVRYLIEASPEKAINLVWQKGSELRRCILSREQAEPRLGYRAYLHSDTLAFRNKKDVLYTWYRVSCIHWRNMEWHPSIDDLEIETPPEIRDFTDCSYPTYLKSDATEAEEKAYKQRLEYYDQKIDEYHKMYEEKYKDALDRVKTYIATCSEALNEWIQIYKNKNQQYKEIVSPLFDLPQLFIAA